MPIASVGLAAQRATRRSRVGTYPASHPLHYKSQPRGNFVHKEGGHIVETAVEARAGFLDKPTLTVLIVSTILTIAMFVLIYSFVFAP
jgi:hypothetical protein